jgi:hypothetical protein
MEVWLFAAIAAVGLLGFMSTLSTSDVHGLGGGEEATASANAERTLEELKRQPFPAGPQSGSIGGLEPGYTATFKVIPIPGSAAPHRQARISVTVRWGGEDDPPQAVTLETVRTE